MALLTELGAAHLGRYGCGYVPKSMHSEQSAIAPAIRCWPMASFQKASPVNRLDTLARIFLGVAGPIGALEESQLWRCHSFEVEPVNASVRAGAHLKRPSRPTPPKHILCLHRHARPSRPS